MNTPDRSRAVRIANCSGFFGDRLSAASEMVNGGDIDVLTGDWLAELTMLILHKQRLRNPELGYASTFLRQMEQVLASCIERGIKVVTNAGGLNPAGCAGKVREIAARLGLDVAVAHVDGDDLMDRIDDLRPQLDHLDTGAQLTGEPVTANAYLGGWGITAALRAGADVVVCGRVTDAAIVLGPAAWWHDWAMDDWDALAGAVVAGHVIECGTQATGGNFARFTEIADLAHPGFPIAEIRHDGSAVITKHDRTGGAVTVDTVTAQLLYEIGGARYAGPDVTTRFDTVDLHDDGPDRVLLTGAVGEPPPPTLKMGINTLGGYRNEVVFVLTGLDIDAKAALVQSQMDAAVHADIAWTLARTDHDNAGSEQEASALLHCVVRSDDADAVGRVFSGAAIELALASYPGFHVTAPPSKGSPYGVFTSAYVPAEEVDHVAVLTDGTRIHIDPPATVSALEPVDDTFIAPPLSAELRADAPGRPMPLGTVAMARSGDKGGSANIGVWVRTDDEWAWLANTLTVDRLRDLLPETNGLEVTRHVLANLRALNFVVEGILGEGVASNARFDPQAKALGEWLRSRHVHIPDALVPARSAHS